MTDLVSFFPSTKILILDSSHQRFKVYQRILEEQGFELKFTDQVDEMLELFTSWQPGLVILDLTLCMFEHADLVAKIKRITEKGLFVPVLLASDENENKLLQHALTQKADSFLKIPFSETVLLAKIYSLLRIRELYAELKENRDQVEKLHLSLQQEHKDAERIYEKFVRPSSQEINGFKSFISAASIFNGDLLLARVQASGDVVILLGDFTGHGLSAAIGVVPVAEMFNGMMEKARGVAEIIMEINTKLHRILPAHLFFGCAILQVSPSQRKARVYNCGMPDLVMVHPEKTSQCFPSNNLPLGVVESRRLDLKPATIELEGDEVFYMVTDGVIEALNSSGEMFGYHRLEKTVSKSRSGIETLVKSVSEFCGGSFFEDDISIAQLSVNEVLDTNYIDSLTNLTRAANWQLQFIFDHHTLKQMQRPIEGVVDMMMQIQPIANHKERISIVLDELFNNALDHGVLQLDSSLKQQEDGFLKFLTKRQQQLEKLASGFIEIVIQHKPLAEYEGEMVIKIHDSGKGFDYKTLNQPNEKGSDQTIFSGRGLLLARSLCHQLEFQGDGNVVKAVYRWNLRQSNG